MKQLTVFALMVVSFSSMTRPPATIEVTLFVDTDAITAENLSETCNFGQPAGISNEDYTIEAAVGDEIVWKGVSTSDPENDRVRIFSIEHRQGIRAFGRAKLKRQNAEESRVRGIISRGKPGEEEKYDLVFFVVQGDERNVQRFRIDPKLRIIK